MESLAVIGSDGSSSLDREMGLATIEIGVAVLVVSAGCTRTSRFSERMSSLRWGASVAMDAWARVVSEAGSTRGDSMMVDRRAVVDVVDAAVVAELKVVFSTDDAGVTPTRLEMDAFWKPVRGCWVSTGETGDSDMVRTAARGLESALRGVDAAKWV